MKKTLALALAMVLAATVAWGGDVVFQYSTIDALLAGVYDGQLSIDQLKRHGNFGLGTLNRLDGELVVLDGEAYHIAAGGAADLLDGSAMVPFATVMDFDEDAIVSLEPISSLEALNHAVREHLTSENFFQAIRVDGRFSMVKTRAIPPQNRPYQPLADVVHQQVVVTFAGVEGTLVGFWTPQYMKGLNVPGFHWHFIARDRTRGGHVLDVSFSGLVARIDVGQNLCLQLPEAIGAIDLAADRSEALEHVEKNPAQ